MSQNRVQEASVNYVRALTWFHDMNLHVEASRAQYGSALREDESALRQARDEMYDAQNELNEACLEVAKMNQ